MHHRQQKNMAICLTLQGDITNVLTYIKLSTYHDYSWHCAVEHELEDRL